MPRKMVLQTGTQLGQMVQRAAPTRFVLTLLMRANGNGKDRITVLSIWDGQTLGMGGGTNDLFWLSWMVDQQSTLISGLAVIF